MKKTTYLTALFASIALSSCDDFLDKLPDNASETLRLVRIGDYDVCACIGQHVQSTREIGSFRITSTSYKDGVFRIVYKVNNE